MFISHKYKVIFVHIQKTGGTSIEKAFDECDPFLIKRFPINSAQQNMRHCFASTIKSNIDDGVFKSYLKFSVVRNPFDRMVSWYSMFKHKTGGDIFLSSPFPDLEAFGNRVVDEVTQNASNFEEFVMLPENHVSGLFKRFYVNQLDYISKDQVILVNKVLRFENLAHDFENFAKDIGFDGILPKSNKSIRDTNYQNYYNEDTKNSIQQRFLRDMEYFGYNF